jgi:hypothetical protein
LIIKPHSGTIGWRFKRGCDTETNSPVVSHFILDDLHDVAENNIITPRNNGLEASMMGLASSDCRIVRSSGGKMGKPIWDSKYSRSHWTERHGKGNEP